MYHHVSELVIDFQLSSVRVKYVLRRVLDLYII